MNEEFKPRFVRRYENLALRIRTAVDEYVTDVRTGRFPSEEEAFSTAPQPPRKLASVSAIAFAGGCAAPDSPSSDDGDSPFYSTPRKSE
jgi:hypothetical protein